MKKKTSPPSIEQQLQALLAKQREVQTEQEEQKRIVEDIFDKRNKKIKDEIETLQCMEDNLIQSEFEKLLAKVNIIKKRRPDFIPPWELNKPQDQRVYQIRNVRDAIFKVLPIFDPSHKGDQGMCASGIHNETKKLGLSYVYNTIQTTLSVLKCYHQLADNRSVDGFKVVKVPSRFCHPMFAKVKA